MYHILIYPHSGFQNYQELFQEIFEKHNIENPFCDISNCCNTSPCNKGKFYQSFITFDSFSFIPKFKRNQKYLVLYQKNILQVLENAYMQDQTIEKSGSHFLNWIQQNKSQYSQFSTQYLQSTSKSVMYMDYSTFEKSPLPSILSIMKFLEPNFPFDQDIVFSCLKAFTHVQGKPNYATLYTNYLQTQLSQKEEEPKDTSEEELKPEIANHDDDFPSDSLDLSDPSKDACGLCPLASSPSGYGSKTDENSIPETIQDEPKIDSLPVVQEIKKEAEPLKNPLDGFNAEMEAMYLELIMEKRNKKMQNQQKPKPLPAQKKPNPSKHTPPKKQTPTKPKPNQIILFQKQQMIQKQLQKAKAQNKQFQKNIISLHSFPKNI